MKFEPQNRTSIFGRNWNEFAHKTHKDLKIIEDEPEPDKLSLKDIIEMKLERQNSNSKSETERDNEFVERFGIRFESIISFPYFLIHIRKMVTFLNDPNGIKYELDDKELLNMYNKKYYDNDPEGVMNFIFHLLKYRFLFDKFIIKRDYDEKENAEGRLVFTKNISTRQKLIL